MLRFSDNVEIDFNILSYTLSYKAEELSEVKEFSGAIALTVIMR